MSEFTDDMRAALKVMNPRDISLRYGCPVIIYNGAAGLPLGRYDRRAVVHVPAGGEWKTATFRPDRGIRVIEGRRACVQEAKIWATQKIGLAQWVPTGYPHSWMPKHVHARMTAELAQWREEQAKEAIR